MVATIVLCIAVIVLCAPAPKPAGWIALALATVALLMLAAGYHLP